MTSAFRFGGNVTRRTTVGTAQTSPQTAVSIECSCGAKLMSQHSQCFPDCFFCVRAFRLLLQTLFYFNHTIPWFLLLKIFIHLDFLTFYFWNSKQYLHHSMVTDSVCDQCHVPLFSVFTFLKLINTECGVHYWGKNKNNDNKIKKQEYTYIVKRLVIKL